MAYALQLDKNTIERVSPEEYLRREREAFEKSEYFEGQIVAMAGARPDHNKITTDLTVLLSNRLRPSGCEVYNSDQRIRLTGKRAYFYPDVSVVCGDESLDEDDCLLNPTAIFEVLSTTTEQRDRVSKWLHYQQLPSLCAYVLVSQEQVLVEAFERQSPEADWVYRSYTQLEETLSLQSLKLTIPLAEIYRRLRFEPVQLEHDT